MEVKERVSSTQTCSRCTLPTSFPGISLNAQGVCHYCLDYKGAEFDETVKEQHRRKFDILVNELKGKSNYDAIMSYSGGKDSTYTLAVLKDEYHLNTLAVTFDNGFLPDQTMTNIRNVVEKLGIDHMMIKPRFDVLAGIFNYCANNFVYPIKALERSSAICTSCMGIIKYATLRLALEKGIPFVAWGWSPGQAPISSSILKNIPLMVKQMQNTLYRPLFKIAGNEIKPYFLEDIHVNGSYRFPYNINPLAFLNYDIEAIYQKISRLGWQKPEDVDANSTNCLLNSYANYVHKKQMGFHPYAFELASLVRQGYMDRATALERLNREEDPRVIEAVMKKLNHNSSNKLF